MLILQKCYRKQCVNALIVLDNSMAGIDAGVVEAMGTNSFVSTLFEEKLKLYRQKNNRDQH